MEFSKKAYLLRAAFTVRKTLDIICYVQSGFPIKKKIDEKTGLEPSSPYGMFNSYQSFGGRTMYRLR
jgi:hypothetical protein